MSNNHVQLGQLGKQREERFSRLVAGFAFQPDEPSVLHLLEDQDPLFRGFAPDVNG